MSERHLAHLQSIMAGPEFVALAKGNAQTAKQLRKTCFDVAKRIEQAFHASNNEDPDPAADDSYPRLA